MMEAKDTVMRDRHKEGTYIGNQLLKQAEISFKVGIKEVVDWIRLRGLLPSDYVAKLKDWGIGK